jgi:hypothetical protein
MNTKHHSGDRWAFFTRELSNLDNISTVRYLIEDVISHKKRIDWWLIYFWKILIRITYHVLGSCRHIWLTMWWWDIQSHRQSRWSWGITFRNSYSMHVLWVVQKPKLWYFIPIKEWNLIRISILLWSWLRVNVHVTLNILSRFRYVQSILMSWRN